MPTPDWTPDGSTVNRKISPWNLDTSNQTVIDTVIAPGGDFLTQIIFSDYTIYPKFAVFVPAVLISEYGMF